MTKKLIAIMMLVVLLGAACSTVEAPADTHDMDMDMDHGGHGDGE